MRFLAALVLSMLLMAASCTDESSSALRRSQIARSWIKNQPDSLQRWVLYSTFDPYQDGKMYPCDPANPEILELAATGVFHQYDTAQQSYGQWFVNPLTQTMNLRYEVRNNRYLTSSDPNEAGKQQYYLKRMTADSLVMEVQGRHGMLILTYLPYQEELP